MNLRSVEKCSGYNEKDFFLILRAFAIFSVVCAHVTDSKNTVINHIISSIGAYGVVIFFILSGYVFFYEKRSFCQFLERKVFTIFIPWMFCGTLDWLYTVLRKGGISFSNWISATFVYSHYYYLTVLVSCYFLMWPVRKSRTACLGFVFLSAVSIFLTGKGILSIYPYVNVLNWIGYFSLGTLIAQGNAMEKIHWTAGKVLPGSLIIAVFAVLWIIWDGVAVSYWYHGTCIVILYIVIVVFGLAQKMEKSQFKRINDVLKLIGRFSYTIYLIHMPFAGVLKYLFDKQEIQMLQLILPFVVLSVVTITVFVITKIPFNKKAKNIINIALGVRT